jgi:hypothetical protein
MVVIKWSSVIIKWSSVIAYCRGQPWRCDLDAQRHCDGGGDANGGFGRPTTCCCSTQREIFRTPSTARASNPLSFRSFQGPLGQTHTHKPRGLTRYGRTVRRPLRRSFREQSKQTSKQLACLLQGAYHSLADPPAAESDVLLSQNTAKKRPHRSTPRTCLLSTFNQQCDQFYPDELPRIWDVMLSIRSDRMPCFETSEDVQHVCVIESLVVCCKGRALTNPLIGAAVRDAAVHLWPHHPP